MKLTTEEKANQFQEYLNKDMAEKAKHYTNAFNTHGRHAVDKISFNYCHQKHDPELKEMEERVLGLVEAIGCECYASFKNEYHWTVVTIHKGVMPSG